MKEKIISSYVSRLTKNDITAFANSNNVPLTDAEVNLIFETIKRDWQELLYNPTAILTNLQNKLSPATFNHVKSFYNLYSAKLHQL